jgi:hypothetical protein
MVDLGPPIVPADRDFTVSKARSRPQVRWTLAIALLGVILTVIVGTGVLMANNTVSAEEARDLLAMVLTPLFTLLGTVVAFYFKESGSGSSSDKT